MGLAMGQQSINCTERSSESSISFGGGSRGLLVYPGSYVVGVLLGLQEVQLFLICIDACGICNDCGGDHGAVGSVFSEVMAFGFSLWGRQGRSPSPTRPVWKFAPIMC
jgi:hypothetical protein